MTNKTKRLVSAVESYLTELRMIRASGGATGERSSYVPLANLLNAVGRTLKPKVFSVLELADQGAGHPDLGLYAAHQVRRGKPRPGQRPERGVVEVKSPEDNTPATVASDQVGKYQASYGLVLVTNLREFQLFGPDSAGRATELELFTLADNQESFDRELQKPRAFANRVGVGLVEYLYRALSHRATLAEPSELAWLLASYARDGLTRVEAVGDTPSLKAVRSALEDALGVSFKGDKGARFFRSTLVQTLFYGIFSAWVLWSRQTPAPKGRFDWRTAVWHLRAPVLRALFQQITDPGRLKPLGLVEVLDWTASALDRVDRDTFFARFREGEAVPYFYEPFLAEFDPQLRKQLGVWYTPTEVVRYMVARVDKALKDDLGVPDGLAADNVYVLDPCCGTGAYPAEVLRRIAENLEDRGLGALVGARVRQAATERVFGFEIMPAPFVVAHLQVGLTMQDLDAPLSEEGTERAQIFLTNALTGWEPSVTKPLPFPELEEERDRAERVKQDTPILVILGNPPYYGFAGMAVDEERELSKAYRRTKRVRRPEGQGLNDPYIRFYRMAERRIAEKTGRGVICFISNYSWLDGLSFTGMRERFLEAFDIVRIDCLNGDSRKTGKVAPDGSPDPSIFSSREDPVGIRVGTGIATLVRKGDHRPAREIGLRHLWGQTKREELTATAEAQPETLYEAIEPILPLGLPFAHTKVSEDWFNWPSLPELFPVSFPGVKTSRDAFLVDIDLDRLKARVNEYFDPGLSHEEIARRYPGAMRSTHLVQVRQHLLARGGPTEEGFVRFAYRPFDNRWLYWEPDGGLLDRPRPDYQPNVFDRNLWFAAAQHVRKGAGQPQAAFSPHLGSLHLIERGANMFPAYLADDGLGGLGGVSRRQPNLSKTAQEYLKATGVAFEDLFYHALAIQHNPHYRKANADALRLGWPRIPVPAWPDGELEGADVTLVASANSGRELARLLNLDSAVPGVTTGKIPPLIQSIAVPSKTDGRNMTGDDFSVTAGWGHFGVDRAVMPGGGRAVERVFTPNERAAMGNVPSALGDTTFDIHLNSRAYWRNVPAAVWNYKLGGYQVLKKWLSYREREILGRPMRSEEVQHFTDSARRIAAALRFASKRLPTAPESFADSTADAAKLFLYPTSRSDRSDRH